MFDSTTLLTYVVASVAIILAPGPAQALVLARTLSEGRKAGIITAIGLNTATIVHALIAALGLSAVLATSSAAFSIVKYLGATYLLYLGIKAFLAKEHIETGAKLSYTTSHHAFSRAFITGILNPKVAIFFLAYVPQFVDPHRGWPILQFFVLGSILGILDIMYESILACLAATVSNWITSNQRFNVWRQRITGGVLISLGVRLFFTERG